MAEFKEVPIAEKYAKQFSEFNGLSRIEPYNQIFPTGRYTRFHKNIEECEVFEDDVWVCTHPKAGTTWTTEIVWCLKNNLDISKAKCEDLEVRVPFFDFSMCIQECDLDENNLTFDKPKSLQRPRTIKTHLSYEMLPKQIKEKKPKIVCVLRNPRDLCLSYLNHLKMFDNYREDLETLIDMMLNDAGPQYGPYFANILGYWHKRDDPNILVVFFEDMKKDLAGVIQKLADFLDVSVTEEGIKELCDHTHFDSMKVNPMVNKEEERKLIAERNQHGHEGVFMNSGKTGGWKNRMDETTIKRFEEWERKWLKDTGLEFNYE